MSVIVPAFNSASTIERTLDALNSQTFEGPYEVIVVDDGSEDATTDLVSKCAGPIKLVRQSNSGAASARNHGVRVAGGSLLAFTDADCMPTPDWLKLGVGSMNGVDIVQGAVEPEPGATRFPLDRTLWVVGENGLYESANLFVRRELFEALGGFREPFEVNGRPAGEDTWFGWRARRRGARTAFSKGAMVHHAVFPLATLGLVRERARLQLFPPLVATVPELRQSFLFWDYFLSPRTAAFDLAVLGLLLKAMSRSRFGLLAIVPYAWIVARQAVVWRKHGLGVASANLLADAIGAVALVRGSLRSRSPVL